VERICSVLQGHNRRCHARRSAGSLRMPIWGFECRPGHPSCATPSSKRQRPSLEAVVQSSRGPVADCTNRRSRPSAAAFIARPIARAGSSPHSASGHRRLSASSNIRYLSRICAPRPRACSDSSSTQQAPSATTKPSRSTEKGETLALEQVQESADLHQMILFTMPSAMGASAPPLKDHIEPPGL